MSELSKSLSPVELLNSEHIREARRLLSVYCRKGGEMCTKYLEITSKTSRIVGSLRLLELRKSKDYSGIDAGIIELTRKVEELYSMYLSGIWLVSAGNPLVKLLSDLTLEGVRYEKGDLLALSIEKAVALSALGIAVPMKSVAVEL